MERIQELFGFGSVALRNKTNGVYRYSATGFERIITVRKYFSQYPLRSKKQVSLEQ
jgi:hypothetical protein